jgi:hypothetical protein
MYAAMCSNDAKSCYDRVVHSIASFIMQQQNVPASACICVFTTLQNLHHTVRTIYGDSKSCYGATLWAVPYSGVGQSNGAGPAIWTVVSTPVLEMMKDEGFGFMNKTSIKVKQLHFMGYNFVDDTDIIQSGKPGEPFQVLAMRMQAAMDTLECEVQHFSPSRWGESQLSIFVVWRPRKYRPNVSKLTCVHRRPYKMGLLVAGVTGHKLVLLLL